MVRTFLSPRNSRRRLFTLIELLVVIAIIAILASMLLPALQQARDRAKTAQCSSNFKSVASATQFYQADFGDFFPWGAYSGSLTPFWWANSTGTDAYATPLKAYFPKESAGRFAGMVGNPTSISKYLCPAVSLGDRTQTRPGRNANIPHGSGVYYSMAVNMNLVNNYGITTPTRMNRVKKPSVLITYGDSVGTGYVSYQGLWHPDFAGGTSQNRCFSIRHSNATNVVYGDGHLKIVGADEIPSYKWTGYPTNGPAWNPRAD